MVRAATSFETVVPLQARRMVEALRIIRRSEDFQALAVLFKRVKNIAKELPAVAPIDRTALTEPAELALLADLDALGTRVRQLAGHHDYRGALAEIATLRAPVDRFFTDVFVMAEDAPSQDSAPDTHGRTTRLDSHPRRHLGNRSSNGVGQQKWQRSRLGRSRRSSRRRTRRRGEGAARRKKASKAGKYVYNFGRKTDGDGSMKPLLGGKGANLAEMSRIGLPVPPGFTITTEVCTYYYANKRTYPAAAPGPDGGRRRRHGEDDGQEVRRSQNPLLVSVRSGARDSMPGMMDTILNLGLNDQTVLALADQDRQRALRVGLLPPLHPDVRRRRPRRAEAPDEDHEPFEIVIERLKHERYHEDIEDTKLTADDLKELVAPLQGAGQGAHRQGLPERSRGISSGARPAPSSARG